MRRPRSTHGRFRTYLGHPRANAHQGLTAVQQDILGAVRAFVDAEIIPVAGISGIINTHFIVAYLRDQAPFYSQSLRLKIK